MAQPLAAKLWSLPQLQTTETMNNLSMYAANIINMACGQQLDCSTHCMKFDTTKIKY
jgi:hypothetical protein